MSNKELLMARVILRKTQAGAALQSVLADYPLLTGESLERVVEYVNRNN